MLNARMSYDCMSTCIGIHDKVTNLISHRYVGQPTSCYSARLLGQTKLIYCFTDPAGHLFAKCNDNVKMGVSTPKWVWSA